MKVWELIAKLANMKANADVYLAHNENSCSSDLVHLIAEEGDDQINLVGNGRFIVLDEQETNPDGWVRRSSSRRRRA